MLSRAQQLASGASPVLKLTATGFVYKVMQGASEAMPVDPGHEFLDTLEQLAGTNAAYSSGHYPPINNSGFVSDYAVSHTHDEGNATSDLGAILGCYTADQLPVLNALAREFAVCDNWHASIPGPTWPNRLFSCAASSDGLDHSPTTAEILTWETVDGVQFEHGSIFDALRRKSATGLRIYSGDLFPLSAAIKGVTLADIAHFSDFASDVSKPGYPYHYTMIEPNYGDMVSGTYTGGNSQHPRDGVTPGEALIKSVYEAIRASPNWETSLLIVTWDEHGGFYDHVPPPVAVPPGDTAPGSKYNQYGFTFDQYGVRVPAVIVSPLIPAKTIDHRLYDHSSIPATIEAGFRLTPLTQRDNVAANVLTLLSLPTARTTPSTLPPPKPLPVSTAVQAAAAPPPGLTGSADAGNVPLLVHVAMRHDLALSLPSQQHAILARVQSIQTRQQAADYIAEVRSKVEQSKSH
jgi:phospholipase C